MSTRCRVSQRPFVVAVAALVALSSEARAQNRVTDSASAALGAIAGFVFDSSTSRPVRRAMVCANTINRVANAGAARCANTDDGVRYRLDSLPAGRYVPFAMCRYGRRFPSAALGTRSWPDSVPVRSGTVTESVIFDVRDSLCLDPQHQLPRFVRGVFRGRYAGGSDFRGEPQSVFTPCPGEPWPAQGDSARSTPNAWLTWNPLLLKFGGPSVLRTEARGIEGQLFYFARFRGVLIGPRPAGPYQAYSYELVVDSILEARTPGQRECM
jgi:hypothetical protein